MTLTPSEAAAAARIQSAFPNDIYIDSEKPMSEVVFFAVREDVVSLLQIVEEERPLKYVDRMSHVVCDLGEMSHRVGKATGDNLIKCDSFLVADRDVPIKTRMVGKTGHVDQLINPDTITLTPGGVWDVKTLINGRFATASKATKSQDLMKRFKVGLRRAGFTKVKAAWVGPEAFKLFRQGMRLTIGAYAAKEFDLVL
ncbi:MAG TPA: hypothetical protein VFY29_08100 [Terriglobia bacterium]|nr:hypothetical protein [Terriglobia bacterium]